jgi:hypothetical protein
MARFRRGRLRDPATGRWLTGAERPTRSSANRGNTANGSGQPVDEPADDRGRRYSYELHQHPTPRTQKLLKEQADALAEAWDLDRLRTELVVPSADRRYRTTLVVHATPALTDEQKTTLDLVTRAVLRDAVAEVPPNMDTTSSTHDGGGTTSHRDNAPPHGPTTHPYRLDSDDLTEEDLEDLDALVKEVMAPLTEGAVEAGGPAPEDGTYRVRTHRPLQPHEKGALDGAMRVAGGTPVSPPAPPPPPGTYAYPARRPLTPDEHRELARRVANALGLEETDVTVEETDNDGNTPRVAVHVAGEPPEGEDKRLLDLTTARYLKQLTGQPPVRGACPYHRDDLCDCAAVEVPA